MSNPFYNPQPSVNFLTLRTNNGFAAGHIPRTLPKVTTFNQPNALPLGEGFAPEIPAAVMEQMVGDRLTSYAEAAQPPRVGTSGDLQATHFV
tara:strand:+ start:126 stop:401 length:276 start_codon:yes stop_codon:yes gene_type:complete